VVRISEIETLPVSVGPGYEYAVIIVLVVAGLLVVKDLILGERWFLLIPMQAAVWARMGVLTIFYAAQVLALLILSRRHGLSLVAAFGLGRLHRSWRDHVVSAALVAGLFLATRVATTLYGAAARLAGWEPPPSQDLTALFGAGLPGFALAIVMVAVVAPVIEELVFRGVVQGSLARFGPWVAIAGSAAVFGAFHLSLQWFVPIAILGLSLGWLAWFRKGLWPPIVLHIVYNAVVVVAAFWQLASG